MCMCDPKVRRRDEVGSASPSAGKESPIEPPACVCVTVKTKVSVSVRVSMRVRESLRASVRVSVKVAVSTFPIPGGGALGVGRLICPEPRVQSEALVMMVTVTALVMVIMMVMVILMVMLITFLSATPSVNSDSVNSWLAKVRYKKGTAAVKGERKESSSAGI